MLALSSGYADDIKVASVVLTSGVDAQAGKRVQSSHFTQRDYILQYTDLTWSDAGQDGGVHHVRFSWYKGDQLVSSAPHQMLHLTSTHYTKRAAGALGSVHFCVETIVDGQVVSSSKFDVSS